jgi:abhydrolase domain-containing protein 17
MRQLPYRKLSTKKFSWKRVMGLLLFIYTCFGIYIFFRADSMMFSPQPVSYKDTKNILKIPVTASEQISAIYLPNAQAKYTLLYIHGNAEDLGDVRSMLDRLQGLGFSIFAYDYRGYGTSNGTPSLVGWALPTDHRRLSNINI